MKLPSIWIWIWIVMLMISGLGVVVDSQTQTDSCSSNLQLLNLNGVGFDTSSLNCISAWDTYNYILRYAQSGGTTWSFVLSVPSVNAYVAIGFSDNGQMVGSSAVVGWISGNSGTIKQYKLDGVTPNMVKPDQGDLVVNSSMIMAHTGRIFLAFQLITVQPKPQLIYALGNTGALPAPPTNLLTQHQDRISTSINYVSGQSTATETPYSRLRRSHGFLSILSWGVLMVIGGMVARYCREWDPQWFYLHAVIQIAALVLGAVGIVCGLVLEDHLGYNISTHKALGIFILVLASLQMTALVARPDKTSKARKYWNWYHHNAGRILFIVAAVNIFYGIHLGEKGTGWRAGYAVLLALLVATSVVLELRILMKDD